MDLPNIPMCTAFTVLALVGLVKAFRGGHSWVFAFASAMVFFPWSSTRQPRNTITGVRWTRSWVVLAVNAFRFGHRERAKVHVWQERELVLEGVGSASV